MYDNLIKQKILDSLGKILIRTSRARDQFVSWDSVYKEFTNGKSSEWRGSDFEETIVNLGMQGYLEIKPDIEGQLVRFTKKGVGATSGKRFLKKNQKILLKYSFSIILTFCNVCIAIAAVIALNKSGEVRREDLYILNNRIDSIQNKSRRDSIIIMYPSQNKTKRPTTTFTFK